MNRQKDIQNYAREYVDRGWALFPIVSSEKKPYAGSSGFKEATTDRQRIDKAWDAHPDSNIAIATGRVSDLVVVDIDVKHGAKGEESALALDLPETLEARTPSGGRHLYYKYPTSGAKVGRKINWRPGIDLLGDGGYVVASPSVTAEGSYEWLNERACASLPEVFLEAPTPVVEGQVLPAQIRPGGRNTYLFKQGCRLRTCGADEITLLRVLRVVNEAYCSPPLEDSEVVRIAKSAAKYDDDGGRAQKSSASQILGVLDELSCELFHTPDRQPFISFEMDVHRETWALDSAHFKNWLCAEVYRRHGKSPSKLVVDDALSAASGKALFEGSEREVHLRVARDDGCYYIDLCNEHWQAVRVSEGHWEIENAPPVRFRRTGTMRALPIPEGGGRIDDLLEVMNLRAEDLPMVVTYILDAFRPDTPYPILELTGLQGSAKSTTQDRIRQLIDPNQSNLRTDPRSDEDPTSPHLQ